MSYARRCRRHVSRARRSKTSIYCMFTCEKLRNTFCVNSPSIVCTDSTDDGRAAHMCVFLRNRCTLAGCVCVCVCPSGTSWKKRKSWDLDGKQNSCFMSKVPSIFTESVRAVRERERERHVTHKRVRSHWLLWSAYMCTYLTNISSAHKRER